MIVSLYTFLFLWTAYLTIFTDIYSLDLLLQTIDTNSIDRLEKLNTELENITLKYQVYSQAIYITKALFFVYILVFKD